MDIENVKIIGGGVLAASTLLGIYYLLLKIRELHSEHSDPKLAYVTYSQMERTRGEIMHCLSESVHDLRSLRSEIREEVRSMQKQYSRSLLETRELIGRNAQNISALAAQNEIANQRICELSVKTDRMAIKFKEDFE